MAFVAILVLSATSARAFTNYLANPGFETGTFTNWYDTYNLSHSVDSTNGYVYGSGNTIHEPAHSGMWTVKEWGCFWGVFWQDHTVYQLIPAASNSTWSADVWAYTATPDNIKGQNWAQLQVIFMDATTNAVAGGTFTSADINSNAPVNTWIHLIATNSVDGSTNLTAPVGTAFVWFGLYMNQDPAQSGGSVYWDDANLIKTASTDPEISASPQDLTVIYGQTATFTVLASGKTPLTYSWQKDGNPVSNGGRTNGATTATLTISGATTDDQGSYTATVTDAAGSLTSSPGVLTVLDPGILTNPVSLVRIEGQAATFSVVAAGSGTLTYVWYKGITPLSNGGRIWGADTATLTITNLTVADSDDYPVTVSGVGLATSTAASLYVSTVAQASQLMRNPGFEMGTLAYWTHWNGAGVETAPGGGEANYDGSYICGIWGTGAGTWNGINQSFTPAPGYVYSANAWFLVSGTPISDDGTGWLELNFYYNGATMATFHSPIIDSNSVVGVWTNVAVSAVAPAGANEIRCQINWHAGGGGAGIIYVDDVSCWLKIPVTVTPSVSGTNFLLSFPTQIGVQYQVLYKNDLTDATWQMLTNFSGDLSGQANVPDPMGGRSRRFYRVNMP